MSRFSIICSLVIGLSSSALVSHADAGFAKPPQVAVSTHAARADVPVSAGMRIAPQRRLDRAQVRAALAKARATNLAAFRAYQKKGVFPSNTFTRGKANVWLDAAGNYCAAATIIKMSGQDALVAQVAEQNNFIRLADVEQGPLMDWMLTSGFTQDEIALIQEPFMPVMRAPVEPSQPRIVDSKLRKAEDRRLRATYKAVDKRLVEQQKSSLDRAADRLMKHPDLAWKLVDAQA